MPNGVIRWGTKMGITEVSMQAEEFVAKNLHYHDAARHAINNNLTLIFEWCSRQQRIVVDYPEDNLVLLAIRDNTDGEYVSRSGLQDYSKIFNIPLVNSVSGQSIEQIRAWDDGEGVVISFEDGHKVKVKADSYVTLHRAKSLLDNERDVVELVINEKFDDLLPLLNEVDKKRIMDFNDNVFKDMRSYCDSIMDIIGDVQDKEMSKKDFALVRTDLDAVTRSFVFKFFETKLYDGGKVFDGIRAYCLAHLGTNSQFEKLRKIITVRWKIAAE
jgi:RNA ligase